MRCPETNASPMAGGTQFERVRHAFNHTRQELRDKVRANLESLR